MPTKCAPRTAASHGNLLSHCTAACRPVARQNSFCRSRLVASAWRRAAPPEPSAVAAHADAKRSVLGAAYVRERTA